MASAFSRIDRSLMRGKFTPVSEIQPYQIPNEPGLYCIKLTTPHAIPKKYGEVRSDGIIYIGQASKSLHKRLWEEELNHKRPATFFRSIGAVLGYLPPEGSLAGKNTRNFKFNAIDTLSIQKWMKLNLSISFNILGPSILDDCEKHLIQKYAPLFNTEHNPAPSEALRKARQHCVDVAKGVADGKTVKPQEKAALPIDYLYIPQNTVAQPLKPAKKPKGEKPMPEAKPWYKNKNTWSLIMLGFLILSIIGFVIAEDIEFKREMREQRERAKRPQPTWADIMTEEELKKTGLDRALRGPDIKKTDPAVAAKNVRELIENGGNADPALDAIQDGDYHNLLDQMGGEEGF